MAQLLGQFQTFENRPLDPVHNAIFIILNVRLLSVIKKLTILERKRILT